MAFTKEDRDELARIRRRAAELEVEERAAVGRCAGIMLTAGLELAGSLANVPENWAEVFWTHADAIRDALEPFDSGIRQSPPL